jgi:hypothetical protein
MYQPLLEQKQYRIVHYVRKWSLYMLINVLMYKVRLVVIFPIVKKTLFSYIMARTS